MPRKKSSIYQTGVSVDGKGDVSIVRSVSLPLPLFEASMRHHVKLSEALHEGLLMLLHQSKSFAVNCDDFEKYGGRGLYIKKVARMAAALDQISKRRDEEEKTPSNSS